MGKLDKIENTSKKVAEIIAVLRILFEKTSKKHTLKKKEIIDIAKKEFDVNIEQRRCADIIDALEYISNTKLLKSSSTSKSIISSNGAKLYRDNFILSDDDIDLIIEILGQSTLLSLDEYNELKDHLSKLATYGHQASTLGKNNKIDSKIKEFRKLKNIARKPSKDDNGARRFEIDFDSITNDQIYTYPKVPLTKKMILNGFVIDIIDTFHNELNICLLIDLSQEYRILLILPLSKVKYSRPKDDWGLEDMKLNLGFLYGNNSKNYKDIYEAIEDYKQGTNDIIFNFEIRYQNNDGLISESHDKIVKEALKRFYPSQFSKMKFKYKKDGYVYVKFNSTINHFYNFYLSNINLLGCLGLLEPYWLSTKLCNYADLIKENNSEY